MMNRLRTWWQIRTGEEETPFDGDTPAWVVSLVIHLGLLVLLTAILRELPPEEASVLLTTTLREENLEVPQEFEYAEVEDPEIGSGGLVGAAASESFALIEDEISQVDAPEVEMEHGEIIVVEQDLIPTGIQIDDYIRAQGAAGEGVAGALGAIDRITQEILNSLEERKTLVVWIFDQSMSLSKQRAAIRKRMDRIYEELGVIEASNHPGFAKHDDKPLLTSVVAFGERFSLRTPKPTDQMGEIKTAIASIPDDQSGEERVFAAIHASAEEYKRYVERADRRNVMMVVFTDEAGDDAEGLLDRTVKICRRHVIPVYVVGVPAPFGRNEVEVKWIDPDPRYNQDAQWSLVRQGPETLAPERIRLRFSGTQDDVPIDSGFGSFGLTRLAYETGGIYFSVHPNRDMDRAIGRGEIDHLSAYLRHFFDADVMRQYRPDYVSVKEYKRGLRDNGAKLALVQAAELSWVTPMSAPKLWFPKPSEAELINALSEAQKEAAKLEPKVESIYSVLRRGERDRPELETPRWQAGYDLAMGRALATKVRTENYNAMLAKAKRGMKFQNARNDTWQLKPSKEVTGNSRTEKEAAAAQTYLKRVVDDHAGTPWALLAARELRDPMGWKWTELHTGVNTSPRQPGNNNNNNDPRDDRRNRIERKPRRDPPKL